MTFDEIARLVAGVPFMKPEQGRILYAHIRETRPEAILELGTAHGIGAAYMAAAVDENGHGHVTTVEGRNFRFTDPAPGDLLEQTGLSRYVTLDRRYSTYTWFLKSELERGARYDFVFLDGQKNWTTDGLAVLLIERLLNPGGWVLMDDLGWAYDTVGGDYADGMDITGLSDEERTQPHLHRVFDLLVVNNPAFDRFRVQDDWWGWARKGASPERVLSVEVTRPWRWYAVEAGKRATAMLTAMLRG